MRLIIFQTGSLGDTLAAVPALWAVRAHFSSSRITLLTDRQRKGRFVGAQEVLDGSGLIDDWLTYPVDAGVGGKILSVPSIFSMLWEVRHRRFDGLVYLIRNRRGWLRRRDLLVFRFAGIGQFYGADGPSFPHPAEADRPLPTIPHQGEFFLKRLNQSGIPVPAPRRGRVDVGISDEERAAARRWQQKMIGSEGRIWVAVGPGSKMPAKRWPTERFQVVVERLIARYDIWPAVFGGPEDRELGDSLVASWGRGTNAAGVLRIREGIAALEECAFYLGNDTGTMHMAVSVGISCVAIFSARDYPGLWYPYGTGHTVLRKTVECEGCMLQTCTKQRMKCLMDISAEEVYQAAEALIQQQMSKIAGRE